MANRPTKRSLRSSITTEMQIKTTVKYHFTPVRIAIIKKTTNNGKKGTLGHCWWECKLAVTVKNCGGCSKTKIQLSYDPAILFLGIYLEKKMKMLI